MATQEQGNGWNDLVATFTSAGVPVPPIPAALQPYLERRDRWFWSKRDLERGELYDPQLLMDEATSPLPDYVAITRVGHGVTSYFMTYQAVFGPVALFAQTGWGGVYMDDAAQNQELAAQFEAVARILDLADSWPEIARLGHRLLVAESAYKDTDSCTWLEIDGRSQPGLNGLRRTALRKTALSRAAQLLDSQIQSFQPAVRRPGAGPALSRSRSAARLGRADRGGWCPYQYSYQ